MAIPLSIQEKEFEMDTIFKKTTPNTTCSKQDEILSRRAVLRAGLMLSCSLFVPIALISSPANGAAAPKLAKAGVKYQAQPKGAQKCSLCTNYIAASKTCQRVEGPVSPDGWCVLWAKKA
jgi:hypothetical protein